MKNWTLSPIDQQKLYDFMQLTAEELEKLSDEEKEKINPIIIKANEVQAMLNAKHDEAEKTSNARHAAHTFTSALNSFSFSNQEFADEVVRSHRTIQQSAMRAILATIKAIAEQKCFDDRNEASVMMARKIVEAVDDMKLPFI